MGVEVERKFLVVGEAWRTSVRRTTSIRQGYVATGASGTVRVRVAESSAFLTLKGATSGPRRSEFEYPIPLGDAEVMLATLCVGHLVEKRRHELDLPGAEWVVDVFSGHNAGLVMLEVEAGDEAALNDALAARPTWVGREVTGDGRFANAVLASRPYTLWPASQRPA